MPVIKPERSTICGTSRRAKPGNEKRRGDATLSPSTLPSSLTPSMRAKGYMHDADDEAEAGGDAGRLGGRELAGVDAPDHQADGEEPEPGAKAGAQDAIELQALMIVPQPCFFDMYQQTTCMATDHQDAPGSCRPGRGR